MAEGAHYGTLLKKSSVKSCSDQKGQAVDRINVALAPDLDIKAQDFVDAWNASEESHAVAVAKADHADAEHFEPLSLTAVLVGIAAGVATNIISELIKKALESKKAGTHVEVREITSPDSSRTLIVTTSAE